IGIVPLRAGQDDRPHFDEGKNLVVCPLRHDADFMQLFYTGWRIVTQVIAADARMPREAALPDPIERAVAYELVSRAAFPVLDIIDVLGAQAQPQLLRSQQTTAA